MRAPFLWAFVSYSAGILAGVYLEVPFFLLPFILIVAVLSFFSASFRIVLAAQMLFIFVIGVFTIDIGDQKYETSSLMRWVASNENEMAPISGRVLQTPEISRDFFVLRVQIDSVGKQPVSGVLRISVTGMMDHQPVTGDQIESFARMRLPSNFLAKGAFDYRRYLRKEGVHALGSVKHPSLVRVVKRGSGFRNAISRMRLSLIGRISDSMNDRNSGVLRAIWLDDRSGLDRETEQTMIDAGVFHVVAISGFHVAVLLLICFFALKRSMRFRIASVLLCVLLLFYLLLLEGRSSIMRSFLTFVILTFAFWRCELIGKANVLCLSALLQLVLNPMELFDTGFHLTYLCTGAILFLGLPVCAVIPWPRQIYRTIGSFLLISIVIQFVLSPYQALVFHRIPFSSLGANIIAVPVSCILIAAGPLILPLSIPFRVLSSSLSRLIDLFINGASFFSGTWLKIVPSPPLGLVIGFYAAIIVLLMVRRWRYRAIAALICLVCFYAILFKTPDPETGSLKIHVIDVGQGDAILIQYPDGTVDLVDGGGFWNDQALDIADAVLLPYLSHHGIVKLHRIFLSHAHADHMNGLISLMRYIPADVLYVTRKPLAEPGFQRLIVRSTARIQGISRGITITQGHVRMQVLAPDDSRNTLKVANDDSMVIILEYQRKRILLMGDAEAKTENRLVDSDHPMRVDVLKVGHHGSKTSTTTPFLNQVRPYIAIVSAGRNNWFGHPHPTVVGNLRDRHTTVLRTDQLGTVRITINQAGISADSTLDPVKVD